MRISSLTLVVLAACLGQMLGGCVERRLTIKTEPEGALVELNDEPIGPSPVTVGFNWYGNYYVRISMDGYQTLATHRKLKRPEHDKFPWDFFAGVLSSERIVDSYEWTFTLEPMQRPDRDDLIKKAERVRNRLR